MSGLQKILTEFKGINTEFLFNMIEQMNIAGLLEDVRVTQAIRNIRIEDFITMNMIETFIPPHLRDIEKSNLSILKKILLQLFTMFYGNRPLPFYNDIIYGRSTGAPHIIVMMAQLLDIEKKDQILVLGSKSGYMESIIQDMEKNVKLFIIEKVPKIYEITKFNLERIEAGNKIRLFLGDPILSLDVLPINKFDKVLLTGYISELPDELFKIVKIGGLICGPFGNKFEQTLFRYFKTGDQSFDEEDCGKVVFSPLITDYN
ncbi:MAG: protein-L-isoaspartate O-methyltransferase family protein [Promethearchaeota archaeon]